jgi:hypothetical protein
VSAVVLDGETVELRQPRLGEHRVACPKCAKPKAARDDALGVRLEAGGTIVWSCFRCGWRGRTSGEERRQQQQRQPERAAPSPWPVWQASLPIAEGDPAAAYLRARACPLPPEGGDLRWLPQRRHPSGYVGPCLVARVTDAITAERMTLHQTWLARDGSGKAAITKPRLLWPGLPSKGGVVRLVPDVEVTIGLAIAEGIETALSALGAGYPAWACLSAGNIAAFPVLDGIETLTIVADNDGNRAGQEAARSCAERWVAAGLEARVWIAPAEGFDLNDIVQEDVA